MSSGAAHKPVQSVVNTEYVFNGAATQSTFDSSNEENKLYFLDGKKQKLREGCFSFDLLIL